MFDTHKILSNEIGDLLIRVKIFRVAAFLKSGLVNRI